MSKRIFEAVARGIKKSTIGIDGVSRELLVNNVSHQLADVYPRFDYDKFKEACTPDPKPIDYPKNRL